MERILCVFEGEKAERNYFNSLKHLFFDDETIFFLTTYQNDIYELYKQMSEDEDLDMFEVVKELNPPAKRDEQFQQFTREQISQIYLFFDYECHDERFSGPTLIDMLQTFENETENGKLFVSYPMVEAIRDIETIEEYLTRTIPIDKCRDYKRISANRGLKHIKQANKLSEKDWLLLTEANLRKANIISTDEDKLEAVNNQTPLAIGQLERYYPKEVVAILSAFPIFLVDYFGLDNLNPAPK